MQETLIQQPLNFTDITAVAFKWRKHIIIITLAGLILGLIISLLIVPKYKASAIFYPSASNSISKTIAGKESLFDYGNEEQADQVLQILNSVTLKDQVIRHFNLVNHYGIEADDQLKTTKVRQEFDNNSRFERTDYLAVEISVLDTDPQKAADMANYITFLADSMKTAIQQQRARAAYDIVSQEYNLKSRLVDSLQQNLNHFRRNGLYDYFQQSEELNKALVKASTAYHEESARMKIYEQNKAALPDTTIIRAKGRLAAAGAAVRVLQPQVEKLSVNSTAYIENSDRYRKEAELLNILKERMDNARIDVEKTISQKFIINNADKPELKAYPKRWLIVVLSGISAMIIGLCIALFLDRKSA